MKIVELKSRNLVSDFPKSEEIYRQFNKFIHELNSWNFPDDTVSAVNEEMQELNNSPIFGVSLKVFIEKKLVEISKLIEDKHKVVPVNYYRNLWKNRGGTVFGIPMAIVTGAIGIYIGFYTLFAIGWPLGMLIGFVVGVKKDQKAHKEGRQLNVNLKQNL